MITAFTRRCADVSSDPELEEDRVDHFLDGARAEEERLGGM